MPVMQLSPSHGKGRHSTFTCAPLPVQVPARASSLAWRYGQGKSPILSLKTSDPQSAQRRARRPGLGEFERSRMLPCHCGRMLTAPRVKVVQPAREEYSV